MPKSNYYDKLFASVNVAIYVIRDNKIMDLNPEALKQNQLAKDKVIGSDFSGLFAAVQEQGMPVQTILSEKFAVAASGVPQTFETVLCRPSGMVYDAEVNIY